MPIKDMNRAKSRVSLPRHERRDLAVTMARNTVSAVTGTENVAGAVLVCEAEPDTWLFTGSGLTAVVRPGLTLNQAVRAGSQVAHQLGGATKVASLPSDLPYLQSEELESALVRAEAWERTCVRDRSGTGTTLLTAAAGCRLKPAYGTHSWRRHLATGAVDLDLPATSGLRHDVDTLEDLRAPVALDGPAGEASGQGALLALRAGLIQELDHTR